MPEKEDYKRFCETAIQAAEQGRLPLGFQMDDGNELTLEAIQKFCIGFQRDTGLDITGHFFICSDCGRLHVLFEIDYSECDTMIQ